MESLGTLVLTSKASSVSIPLLYHSPRPPEAIWKLRVRPKMGILTMLYRSPGASSYLTGMLDIHRGVVSSERQFDLPYFLGNL